jgi:hypothetical protein
MKTETIMWLLPAVFMIHDFEEIIMFKPWVGKNAEFLRVRFPRLAARLLPHMAGLSTSAFALAVALIFLIITTVTLIAVEFELYALWAGFVIGYFIHLVIHVGQFLAVRRYVPVIVTSIVTAPYCVWALLVVNARHPLPKAETLIWAAATLLFLAPGVTLAHRVAAGFDRWLKRRFSEAGAK